MGNIKNFTEEEAEKTVKCEKMIDLLRFRQYTGINVIPTDRDAGKREAEVHMANHGKGKISYILQAINTIPLMFFGVLILAIGTNWFTKAIYAEVE